ncbi:MAG TPA: T9SS type A sorting domain-containing protein [Bacteroidota bacterium]|nr:T9SS type A sorting domain-containing protein [Bacteroidota bacterium]
MKQKYYSLLILLVLTMPVFSYGQDLVLQDYKASGNQYLNTLIFQDTSSAEFKAGTRVYVLKRDGIYLLNTTLALTNKKLVFRSEYGTGHYDPTIFLYPGTTGNPAGNFVSLAGGSITMKHIILSGYYEPLDSCLDRLQGALITLNSSGSGGSVYIDSCILKSVNGQAIRTDGKPVTVRVTNTIIADMGFLGTSNFGAGKGIDLRDQDVDTCDVQNCTFVNLQDRVIRHYQATKGPIRNFIFNHNTVVNSMSYHGFLSLGRVDSSGNGILQIKNNMFVDHFALGADTAYLRQGEFGDPRENDPVNGKPRMTWVMTTPNLAAKWDISNNYYAVSDSGAAIFAMPAPNAPYYMNAGPALTWGMNTRLGVLGKDTVNNFKQVSVKLTNTPPLMTQMLRWVYRSRTEGGDGKQKNSNDPNFSKTAPGKWPFDYNRKSAEYYFDTLNCKIRGSAATIASLVTTDGKVAGDTRWGAAVTGVVEVTGAVPGVYALGQNYPNPFNPTTSISFDLPKASAVTLTIYNVLGQEVATLVNSQLAAGHYNASFDASHYASGMYLYRLTTGEFSAVKKMLLAK